MLESVLPATSSVGTHESQAVLWQGRIVSPTHSLARLAPHRNRLLTALPGNELERLRPHLESVELLQREHLYAAGASIRFVYFPETAVISLVAPMDGEGRIEIGTAGCEGMAGLPVFLTSDSSSLEAVVQIPGVAARIDAVAFARLATAPSALHRILLRCTQALLIQVSQAAACNAAHHVEERCARWLLMTHDRVASDEFPLTHEFLAFMLGVRRPGVTIAMRALRDTGFVNYRRGSVQIVDRAGLEGVSCECYRVVRRQLERLLPSYATLTSSDGYAIG